MNIFTFDIETIPDTNSGRILHELSADQDDLAVAQFMLDKQREKNGSDFLPRHLHRIVAISVALRTHDGFKVWSLGDSSADEKEIIQRFFKGIEKYTPTIVSWNGSGFDLPVLHYRALLHGVVAERYWEVGESNNNFRYNNYISRYHYRHTDLMDLLAAYQSQCKAPLEEIALMLGLPGKMGMHGSKVMEQYFAGEIENIRNYCETDVLNTHLVYYRFLLMQGKLTEEQYQFENQQVRNFLINANKPHLTEFNSLWR